MLYYDVVVTENLRNYNLGLTSGPGAVLVADLGGGSLPVQFPGVVFAWRDQNTIAFRTNYYVTATPQILRVGGTDLHIRSITYTGKDNELFEGEASEPGGTSSGRWYRTNNGIVLVGVS